MIKVLLAEDHNIVRNGIKMLLEFDKSIQIVAEASNGREALAYVSNGGKVDVVLADINMPELDGLSLIKEIKAFDSAVKVVMLSMLDNEQHVTQAFLMGASGYLLKNIGADELLFAIKYTHTEGKYLCAELAMRMLDRFMKNDYQPVNSSADKIDFSMREMEVLHLIAEGLTNEEMSDKLFISKRTIEGHRQSLIKKTGTKNTAALIRYAVMQGIVH